MSNLREVFAIVLILIILSACGRENLAIPESVNTTLPNIDPAWDDCFDFPESVSVDSNWVALLCNYPANSTGGLYTKVYNKETHLTWLLDIRTVYPYAEALSAFYPTHWSRDGKYLYLTTSFCCADVTWEFSSHGLALHKLDLSTGDVSEILPLPGESTLPVEELNRISYAFAFSPDDEKLIYSSPINGSKFHIKSLLSNKDKVVDLKADYNALGKYEWSPDGSKVIFVGMTENYVKDGLSLLLLNTNEDTTTVVLNHDARLLLPDKWIDQENVQLFSMYIDQPRYSLNVATGETEITATLVPTP